MPASLLFGSFYQDPFHPPIYHLLRFYGSLIATVNQIFDSLSARASVLKGFEKQFVAERAQRAAPCADVKTRLRTIELALKVYVGLKVYVAR